MSRVSKLRRFVRVLTVLASLALLLAAAGIAGLWLLHGQASMHTYRSPMRSQPQSTGHTTTPLARQVVLIIVDGLRDDAVASMPNLSSLRRQGASARALLRAPSLSQPAWTTIVTGAWPEINGAPLINVSEAELAPISVDTIFAAARRANLSTALAGGSWWERMVPRDLLDAIASVEGSGPVADQQATDAAIRFLRNFQPSFLLVHLGNVDSVAHDSGALSEACHEAALEADRQIGDIAAAMDLRNSVLMVCSDHGHIDRGGHGGPDPTVVTTPFVALGGPVIPGDCGTIAQVDIAPTIAAILGAPMPRLNQGNICFAILRCDDAKRAETQVELALQRQEFANLYLASIGRGSLSDTAEGDVTVALSSLEVRNLESAYRLASLAVERIDREVAQARSDRIRRERSLRLPVAAGFIGAPLALVALRGGRRGRWLFFSAAATLLAYHALFALEDGVYSISGITGMRPFVEAIVRRTVAASAMGGLLVLWRLARDHEGSALEVIQTSLAYSLLVVYLLGCQAAVVYWLNGFRFTWYVPDLGIAFWQVTALVQVLICAALSLVLPVILLLAGLAYQGMTVVARRLRAAGGS
ncbi:MAG: alkaline phosphatase family protein [Anaerolineae bacterium]|nr:alkaline phosphatase family protein [Anaerolineae bacterium]